MITNAPLPPELQSALSGETVDFAVKSSRHKTWKEAGYFLMFGTFWMLISLTVGGAFFLPLLFLGEVDIEINNVPTTVTHDNLEVMLFPGIVIGLFIIIGIAILSYAIYATFARGGWYIGRPEGISYYRKGKTEFHKWDEFSGVELKGDDTKGDITLKQKKGAPMGISGVPDASVISKICEERIGEN